MSKTYDCQYCHNTYKSLSSLYYHQKTTKFCLEMQNKILENKENYTCVDCNKVFLVKSNYNQHVKVCKEKKIKEESNIKNELEILKNEIVEFKLKLTFKDETITKLEEEIKEYKKLLAKRTKSTTNIYNDNSNKITIEFKDSFNKLDVFNKENIIKCIKNITQEEIDKYDFTNIHSDVSNTLTDALKELTFCTDVSNKTMITKDEKDEIVRLKLGKFLTTCLQLSKEELTNYFELIQDTVDTKVNNDLMEDTTYFTFREMFKQLKEFVGSCNNREDIFNKKENHPLYQLPDIFIKKCQQISQ